MVNKHSSFLKGMPSHFSLDMYKKKVFNVIPIIQTMEKVAIY